MIALPVFLERFISQAKRAEDAAFSGDVTAILDFHRLIGSNLKLFNATEEDERQTLALPDVPERKSVKEGRRGGFATRADTTPPEAAQEIPQNPSHYECRGQTRGKAAFDAAPVRDEASGRTPKQIPSRLSGRWIGSPSPSSGRRPSPLRGRIRRGFPVLRVEWPGPWKILAERKPTSKWWAVQDLNL